MIFFGLFFLSMMIRGYLYGRYGEFVVDGLKAGYIPTFFGVACAVVAYDFGAGWWFLPLAPSVAFLLSECFAVALIIGRRHNGRRIVLVPKASRKS